MRSRHDQISVSYPGTCNWILDHETFLSWQQGSTEVLWLRGQPGSGKSTLMSFLLQTLTTKAKSRTHVTLHHFFNGRFHGLGRSLEGLLRSLLYQLYSNIPSSRRQLCILINEKGTPDPLQRRILNWQLQDLEAAFLAGLRAIGSRRIVLVLDALDEANANETRAITRFLQKVKVLHDASDGSKKSLQPLLCISCRHYPVVVSIPGPEIYIEDYNRPAIVTYMEKNLQIDLIPAAHLYEDDWDTLVSDLIKTASTSFQWATIVVDLAFKYVPDGDSIHELRQRLLELPPELDDLYKYLLQEVVEPRKRQRALFLLQWVCLAQRPMSTKELRYALAIEGASLSQSKLHCSEMNDFIETDERMKLQITAISGGLVEVVYLDGEQADEEGRTDFVQVVHQSVMDFLLSKGLVFLSSMTNFVTESSLVAAELRNQGQIMEHVRSLVTDMDAHMIRSASHYRLFLACLCYLVLEDAELDKYRPAWSSELSEIEIHVFLSNNPLLLYATTSIFYHATCAQDFLVKTDFDKDSFVQLLDLMFQTWVQSYRTIALSSPYCPEKHSTLLHVTSRYNLFGAVASLLSTEVQHVDHLDQNGSTALHYASRAGHSKIVKLLLQHDADPSKENAQKRTPLIEAAGTESCVQRKCFSSSYESPSPITDGHLQTVRLLLENGCQVDHCSSPSLSGNALQEASRHGHLPLVKLLLDSGAGVNEASGVEGTALTIASLHGHLDIVDLLIKEGANVDYQAGKFRSALTAAAFRNQELIADALLGAGADALGPSISLSPLYVAASRGHKGMFLKLYAIATKHVVRPEMVDALIHASAGDGHPDILRFLLQTARDHSFRIPSLNEALYDASLLGNKENVKQLLEEEVDVNHHITLDSQGVTYSTALEAALSHSRHTVATMLIERGADVNAQGGIHGSSLRAVLFSQMATEGTIETQIQALLAAGVNVDAIDEFGETALQIARRRKMDKVVELLTEAAV